MWLTRLFVYVLIILIAGYLYRRSSLNDNDMAVILVAVVVLILSALIT